MSILYIFINASASACFPLPNLPCCCINDEYDDGYALIPNLFIPSNSFKFTPLSIVCVTITILNSPLFSFALFFSKVSPLLSSNNNISPSKTIFCPTKYSHNSFTAIGSSSNINAVFLFFVTSKNSSNIPFIFSLFASSVFSTYKPTFTSFAPFIVGSFTTSPISFNDGLSVPVAKHLFSSLSQLKNPNIFSLSFAFVPVASMSTFFTFWYAIIAKCNFSEFFTFGSWKNPSIPFI